MRFRLVTLIGFVIAVTAIAVTSSRITFRYPPAVHETLAKRPASYLGAFESGAPPAYRPITKFAAVAGKEPNLAGYYSGWAEPFAISWAREIYQHGVLPFVQIDPSFASVRGIAVGDYDTYLREYADSVRDFGHPVVIGFGHEMNGNWYSWGYNHTSPAQFVAAWQHIVTLFQQEGALNVTWLWTVNQQRNGTARSIKAWWPGRKYVTWVGIDGYYVKPTSTFNSVFGSTIRQVQQITSKPILLSETGVSRNVNDRFADILDLFEDIQSQHLLGVVWFDENQAPAGPYHQDWSLEGDKKADGAFGTGVQQLNLARVRGGP